MRGHTSAPSWSGLWHTDMLKAAECIKVPSKCNSMQKTTPEAFVMQPYFHFSPIESLQVENVFCTRLQVAERSSTNFLVDHGVSCDRLHDQVWRKLTQPKTSDLSQLPFELACTQNLPSSAPLLQIFWKDKPIRSPRSRLAQNWRDALPSSCQIARPNNSKIPARWWSLSSARDLG